MANTSAVYARIDSDLKQSAESILAKLGISPSNAIQMLYSQVVLTRSLPFQPILSNKKPFILDNMSMAEIDSELSKGIQSIKEGNVFSMDDLNKICIEEFNV